MITNRKSGQLFLTLTLVLLFGCKHTIFEAKEAGPSWQSMGFKDKFASRLVISEPYLYACAGPEGLWRLNLQKSDSDWVYVGLADSSLGRENSVGVEDVIISKNNSSWLLAIALPRECCGPGVFKSVDNGSSWAPAVEGLIVSGIQRNPHRLLKYPNFVLAAGGGVVFKTDDFGGRWRKISGDRYGLLEINVFTLNTRFNNVAWLGGETGFFDYYLAKSSDSGNTWYEFDLQKIVPSLSPVRSIVLDPSDSNRVYVGQDDQIIKTIDDGNTWQVILQEGTTAMLIDPRNPSHLWLAWGDQLKETHDSGTTWQSFSNAPPSALDVIEMVWDEKRQAIYIGTLNGIYRHRP